MVDMSAVAERTGIVVRAGSDRGGPLAIPGGEIAIILSSEDTGGAFAVMQGRTQPMEGPPLHSHRSQDEWWHIVEGQYRFEVDGQTILAGPGDTVFAPRGSHHTFQNIGNGVASSIVTVVPGGLDVFFKEFGEAVPRGTVPDPASVAEIFEKYDLELLGPPLANRPDAINR